MNAVTTPMILCCCRGEAPSASTFFFPSRKHTDAWHDAHTELEEQREWEDGGSTAGSTTQHQQHQHRSQRRARSHTSQSSSPRSPTGRRVSSGGSSNGYGGGGGGSVASFGTPSDLTRRRGQPALAVTASAHTRPPAVVLVGADDPNIVRRFNDVNVR